VEDFDIKQNSNNKPSSKPIQEPSNILSYNVLIRKERTPSMDDLFTPDTELKKQEVFDRR